MCIYIFFAGNQDHPSRQSFSVTPHKRGSVLMTTPNKIESSTIEELKIKLQEAEQKNKDLEVKLFEKSSVTSKYYSFSENFLFSVRFTKMRA